MDSPLKISVIIATRGRQQPLLQCLACLARQTLSPGDYEVIVVDDASPVPLTAPPADGGPAVHLVRLQENLGPGGARNAGVAIARGQLLAFTDDDCLPHPDWLEQLWLAHQAHPHTMLGGRLYNAAHHYIGAEASQVISDIVYAYYNSDPAHARFFSTNNAAVPRADFIEVGQFLLAYRGASEDRDLCDRWRASGRRMQYVPSAVVGHAHALTVRKFTKQHFSYGKGAAVFHSQRAQRRTGRLVDEMSFHRRLPVLAWRRLKSEDPLRAAGLLALLGVWQVANAAGYAWQRYKDSRRGNASPQAV